MSKNHEHLQAKGIRWSTSMSVLTFLSQFIALYFLNKIIPPEDFGRAVFALGTLSIGLAFSNLSFGVVGIRPKKLSKDDCFTIFIISFIINSILFLAFYFLIPVLIPETSVDYLPYLRLFSFIFFLLSLQIIPIINLKRNLAFQKISIVNFTSKILSLLGALFFALKGDYFSALVFLYAGMFVIESILYYVVNPYNFKGKWSNSFFKNNIALGISFSMHQFIGSLGNNLDALLIGNNYGEQSIAEYRKSYGYKSMPIMSIAGPIAKVMFPSFSKLQEDMLKLNKHFFNSQVATFFILLPIFGLLFALAKPFTTLYFDEDWNIERITILLQIFSLAGILKTFNPNFYSFFSVLSSAKEINKIVLLQRFIFIIAILITFKLGIFYVAFGILISEFLSLLINIFYAKKHIISTDVFPFLKIIFGIIICGILSSVFAFLFYNYLGQFLPSNILRFLFGSILAAFVYLGASYFINKTGISTTKKMFLNR